VTFQGQVLLPSQEALIQRLHHVASYSDQLLVLVGGQGSGKTTLLTALATDFESMMLICSQKSYGQNASYSIKFSVRDSG